jgi:hypothetical protein
MAPHNMIQQLVAQKYNLFNVNIKKVPIDKNKDVMSEWQKKNYDELVKEHNYNSNLWGISLGRQENGRHIMSLDFDIYVKATNTHCEKMRERFETYDSFCTNNNGMYSSSTDGNKNVLVDYTDSEILMSLVNEFTKIREDGKRDSNFKLESNHLEIFLLGNQVIPPSQTICKKTEKLGNARTFVDPVIFDNVGPCPTNNMFYVIGSDQNCFTFQFVKELFEEYYRNNLPRTAAPRKRALESPNINLETTAPILKKTQTTKNCADNLQKLNLDEYMEYAEIISMEHIGSGAYNTWIRLMWALKSEGDDKLKAVAEKLADRAKRDITKYVDKFWYENGNGGVLTIGTFLHFAKISDESAYFAIREKYHPSLESVFCDQITLDNMITTATNDDFACLYFKTRKGKVFLQDNQIYLYYDNEWRQESEKSCRVLKNDLTNIFAMYIKACIRLISKEMINQLNDKDKTQALLKLQQNMIGVGIATRSNSFISNTCSLLKDKLAAQFSNKLFDVGPQDFYNINFKNGVYDMKAKMFRERYETDYITKTLDCSD